MLAAGGAHVILGTRDAASGAAVAEEIVGNGGRANVLVIDVSSLRSVREAAARYRAAYPALDVLVNNAGVATATRETSVDGHELTWATNFLGPVALTDALVPALEAAHAPRVVNVSSSAHKIARIPWDDLESERGRFQGFRVYAQSKLALNLYTREFARRHPRIAANAVHPGAIATGIWRSAPAYLRAILSVVLPPPARGAGPLVRLATSSDVAAVSGRYFDKLRETEPARASRDDVAARRLWDYAEAIYAAPTSRPA